MEKQKNFRNRKSKKKIEKKSKLTKKNIKLGEKNDFHIGKKYP